MKTAGSAARNAVNKGLQNPRVPAPRTRDLAVAAPSGALAARWYSNRAAYMKQDSLIVFFHGGGFVGGHFNDADSFLKCLVTGNPGAVLLAPNYTLAPSHPFPAAIEDAYAVLMWAQRHKAQLGWTGKRLVVAGIEAGGNLAAVCAMMARDRGKPGIAGQILIMPMLDPGLNTATMRNLAFDPGHAQIAQACAAGYRDYLPRVTDRCHPYAAPLLCSRLKNLPPALIFSTEDDPLRDEAEQYGASLIESGVRTVVRRLSAAQLALPGARNECAASIYSLNEIHSFLQSLWYEAPSGRA